MSSSDPISLPADATSRAPVEVTWRGRVLTRAEVVRVYLLGSVALLITGILLDYILTDGLWYTPGAGVDEYLQFSPYDIASAFILITSLVCLGYGFLSRERHRHVARGVGFVIFGFYWATQAMKLYFAEEGDFVNALFAMFAVFFFNYFAYHEYVSYQRDEDPRALQWLAGTSFITTGVYFVTHKLEPVAQWLIARVSNETQWLLHQFGQATVQCGSQIFYPEPSFVDCQTTPWAGWFPIQIILACTAIQSIMIFVGGILALKPPRHGEGISGKPARFEKLRPTYGSRRLAAFLLTVPLIYVLNLFRNVIIIWMAGQQHPVLFSSNESAFWFAHNVIGKGGSLVALVIIAFIVFQILPELYDSIIGLLDLKDRRGPLESWLGEKFGRRGKGGTKEPAMATVPPMPPPGASAEPHLE